MIERCVPGGLLAQGSVFLKQYHLLSFVGMQFRGKGFHVLYILLSFQCSGSAVPYDLSFLSLNFINVFVSISDFQNYKLIINLITVPINILLFCI